jgi:hypothetical protein
MLQTILPNHNKEKIKKSLQEAGYAEPTDLLINQATQWLIERVTHPDKHRPKTIANWLHDFTPQAVVKPSVNRKLIELYILAATLSLEVPVPLKANTNQQIKLLEELIHKAAKHLTEPESVYARDIALRYGIAFEGELYDCFGFWEQGNQYCIRCKDMIACMEKVKQASLGALINPSIKEFNMDVPLEESQPLRVLSESKSSSEGTLAAVTNRKALLSWLDLEFPELTRVDYTESTNYQISNPFNRKRMVLLKIEKFSLRSYNVVFNVATEDQAKEFLLSKTRYGWVHASPDILKLQESIKGYLKIALDIPAVSIALSHEEEIKQEIQKDLRNKWTGRIEHRSGYDIFVDTKGQKILRFNRFNERGLQLDFSRWNLDKANEYGLKPTSSGARYEGTSKEELEKLLDIYLNSIKSKHFGPKT